MFEWTFVGEFNEEISRFLVEKTLECVERSVSLSLAEIDGRGNIVDDNFSVVKSELSQEKFVFKSLFHNLRFIGFDFIRVSSDGKSEAALHRERSLELGLSRELVVHRRRLL